jgi:transposase-like protein
MGRRVYLSSEEKYRIVELYRKGEEGKTTILKKYGVAYSTLRDWVRLYETRGITGLISYGKSKKYSVEAKIQAVQDYLDGKGSQSEICRKYDISTSSVLRKWIECYNSHGEFKKTGDWSEYHMTKGRKTTIDERIEIVSYCIVNNKDYGKTVEQHNVSYSQIYEWVRKYEKEGIAGLTDRRGKRKSLSTMTEVEKLRAQIKLKEAENLRLQMENDVLKKLEEIERGRSRH